MLHHTRGIALKTTNYSENSIVAQVYTEQFGLQSYLINGARKPKAKIHINMLQPLHLLDMVVYHKENGGLQRIKEAHQSPVLHEIPLDIVKSSMALFLNEVLYKVLRHQQPDHWLFSYLTEAILWLDRTKNSISNFHLVFLMELSRFLGFYPSIVDKPYLDLIEGVFSNTLPQHPHFISEPQLSILRQLMTMGYARADQVSINRMDRKYLLEKTLDFYRLHTENFGEVNSMQVLEEVFS